MSENKIRVLIVDDSAVVRSLLTKILSSDPDIEVVGTAADPYLARDKIIELKPDVMTLDIEMPRMDGITFLEKVMAAMPVRTLIISSLAKAQSDMALRALQLGAIDVFTKPAINVSDSLSQVQKDLCQKIKIIAKANLALAGSVVAKAPEKPKFATRALGQTTHQILAIAASTGGTEALRKLLVELPPDIPGTVIVQHMPPVFTKSFADNLNRVCSFEVKEAEDGDRVKPGLVLIAPGNFHMELTRSGAYYYVKMHQEPPMHGVRPAADYLMRSVAKFAGKNAVGLVLTGMGRDGAQGLLDMHAAGSFNIAQDEASCVVFGMPKVAIEIGAIHKTLPLDQISAVLVREFQRRDVAAG